MDKDILQKNMPVINSIISRAEDSIYSTTGLMVTLKVADTETIYVGIDDLIDKAANELCSIWGVTIFNVFENNRTRQLVAMRSIIYHYIRFKYPSISLVSIAKHFGKTDHATIIHNISNARQFIKLNDQLFHSYYQPIKHLYESKI